MIKKNIIILIVSFNLEIFINKPRVFIWKKYVQTLFLNVNVTSIFNRIWVFGLKYLNLTESIPIDILIKVNYAYLIENIHFMY